MTPREAAENAFAVLYAEDPDHYASWRLEFVKEVEFAIRSSVATALMDASKLIDAEGEHIAGQPIAEREGRLFQARRDALLIRHAAQIAAIKESQL